jgi:hypothetical protein
MAKKYVGERDSTQKLEVYVETDGHRKKLNPQFKLFNHSPGGFESGYNGSGPAQLALAICFDAAGKDRAVAIHQNFKAKVVANLPRDENWELTEEQVLEVIQEILTGSGNSAAS